MAITFRTVTGNVGRLLGLNLPTQDVSVRVRTNLPAGKVPIDLTNDRILLGTDMVDVDTNGDFTVPNLIDHATTSSDVNPTGIQYYFDLVYVDPVTRKRTTVPMGPYSVTSNGDLSNLALATEAPPEFVANPDSLVAPLLAPGSGSASAAALLASYAAKFDNASTAANGALTLEKLTKVDASGAARAMTIPDGTIKGQQIAAEKTDSSANLVTITGKIRSTGSTSFSLTYQYETIVFVWGGTFWEPLSGHRTKASIDTQIATAQAKVTASTQTADYTLALADAGTVLEMNKSTAVTVTIPPESSVAWPAGSTVEVFQLGTGQVTVSGGVGVTVRAPFGQKSVAQYGSVFLRKRGTDEWVVNGDVTT